MADRHDMTGIRSTADAINRVLDAENSAKREIAERRRRAVEDLRGARRQARRIGDRADARIYRVRDLTEAGIRCRLDQLQTEAARYTASPRMTQELEQRLDAAMERLIDELIG